MILNRHRPERGESDLRGWEWRYLWRLCRSDAGYTLVERSNRIYAVSFSPDGRFLAVQEASSEVSVWDLAARRPILSRRTGVTKQRIAFSPVTHQLAFGELGAGGTQQVILWDVAKAAEVRRWEIPQAARELVFSQDGKGLAVLTENEVAGHHFLWDIASGGLRWKWPAARDSRGHGTILALSDKGQVLAVGSPGGRVTVIDAGTGREEGFVPVTQEHTMAASLLNGGKVLASAGGFTDPVIRLWDVLSGKQLPSLQGRRSYINALATSSDGRLLASGSGDQTIRIWDWKEGRSVRTLRGHSSQVLDVAFSPDGQTLASGSRDGFVKLWNLSESRHVRDVDILPFEGANWSFSPDGEWIVAVVHGVIRCWATVGLMEDRRFEALGNRKTSIAFSDNGALLAVGSEQGDILLIHPQTGAETRRFNTGSAPVRVLGFGEEARSLLTVDSTGVVMDWDLGSGQRKHQWSIPGWPAHTGLDRTADTLVAREFGRLAVWRTKDGQELWNRPLEGSNAAGISPDGKVGTVPSGDGFTLLLDAVSGVETATLAGSLLGNHSVGFSSDHQRLAIGGDGMEAVQVWETSLRQKLLTLAGQGSVFNQTRFSHDGRFLGSLGMKGLHLWHAPSSAEIAAAELEEEKKP